MNLSSNNKTILVAPLNWGLGHAARCIPIIKALEENNYIPIIASDGIALELLQKEFPDVKTLQLPSYHIEYSKNGKNLKWKLLIKLPKMIKAIWDEKKEVTKWIKEYEIDGIISDNRLGIFSKEVPSVFITHQLHVMTGNSSWMTNKLYRNRIKKFDECWIPDFEGKYNLTGKLSHLLKTDLKLKYIGPLSRMNKKELPTRFDLMVILSGPEPQRGILEEILKAEIQQYKGKVIFIKGVVEKEQEKEQIEHVTYFNFMNTRQLEQTFNESKIVLCRSGYTTIMDLSKLEKKAFFIPTPGQNEQEYLAEKLKNEGLVPFANQDEFRIDDVSETDVYQGLTHFDSTIEWTNLFTVFEHKN